VVGKSILIVDNNPASRIYLANFLKGKLFQVLEVQIGKEGLIAVWRVAPDLVLFDPVPGDTPDKGFIQKLRNDPRPGVVALVALSSDPVSFAGKPA
jgi:DNA-binding response OmpR family regulator